MFLKFFFCSPVLLFELQAQRLSGQLLSHPKDKLTLKFLLPVLNVVKLFLFLFFDLLCLSFFVLNNVFLVWSGENGILGLDNHHHI